MDEHPVGGLAQFEGQHLAHRHFAVADDHARLDRAPARRAQGDAQAFLASHGVRRLGQSGEAGLGRARLAGRQHFQVLAADQGFQVGGAQQAEFGAYHPELTAVAGDAIGSLQDARLDQHAGEVVGEADGLHLADIDALVAYRRTLLEAVGLGNGYLDQGALGDGQVFVLVQGEATGAGHRLGLRVRGVESDASRQQSLQGFALHFDTRQPALEGHAA
ncbi:hypothetical protein D3C85_1100700 [compost metagenome]